MSWHWGERGQVVWVMGSLSRLHPGRISGGLCDLMSRWDLSLTDLVRRGTVTLGEKKIELHYVRQV